MRRLGLGLGFLSLFALIACSEDGGPIVDPGPVGQASEPIINGDLDYTHDAVLALAGYQHMCTGTIIETNPPYLYILTAAHCVAPHAPSDIIEAYQADDYEAGNRITYSVQDCQAHPAYTGGTMDFAMCRATGASASTPVIAATSSPDGLVGGNPGTAVKHVGYGVIGFNGSQPIGTSDRYYYDGYLTNVNASQIEYNQAAGGPCSGDSGGPQLSGNPEKVVGVTSMGDEYCEYYGVSGRVTAAYSTFIRPYIDGGPIGPLTCDQCFDAVTSGEGACVPSVNACFNNSDCSALLQCFNDCTTYSCQQGCITSHPSGYQIYLQIFTCTCNVGCATECANDNMCDTGTGGSGTGGTGTGGSGTGNTGTGATGTGGSGTGNTGTGAAPTGDGWVAGTADDQKYDGDLQSGCALGPRPRRAPGGGVLPWMGALGLGLLARRRRGR